MRNVALVAPYAMTNTLHYVDALLALGGVRPVVITADDPVRFGRERARGLAAIVQVEDPSEPTQLARALTDAGSKLGGIDRVLGVLEQLQLPLAEARGLAGVQGMDAATAHRFRDKSAMKEALRAAGVPCARSARVESNEDAARFADEVGYPMVLKPVDGLGARATVRITHPDQLQEALSAWRPAPTRPLQLEEMMVGVEHSFETVTIEGEHVWSSATDYLPGPLEVVETSWIQYCVVLPRETSALERFGETNRAALDALGMRTGLSHMEWFARDGRPDVVNEVGARPPGVNIMPLMSLAYGVDMVARWVRLMALDEFDPPERVRAAGSAFLRGHGAGTRVAQVEGVEEALREVGPLLAKFQRPEVGQPRAESYEGEGYALVAANTTAEVHHALATLIRTVQIRYG